MGDIATKQKRHDAFESGAVPSVITTHVTRVMMFLIGRVIFDIL